MYTKYFTGSGSASSENQPLAEMKDSRILTLGDIAASFVLLLSIVSVLTLIFSQFTFGISFGIASALTAAITNFLTHLRGYRLGFRSQNLHVSVLLLLMLTAVFRYEPYSWLAGGQDPGVYTTMSRHFQATGEIFVLDATRESLPPELQGTYDATNYALADRGTRLEGRKEGGFLPGLYVKDVERSQHVFQFYHMHPLWMALFADMLGDERRTYSLVFFALISVLMFYLLAFELTGNRLLAWFAGALLALNPLHAFFSKFPVTEVVAFAFSSMSFYYLLRYFNRAKAGQHPAFFLVLSALSMGCMFFTRISGFMYVPFFYIFLLSVEVFADDQLLRRQLRIYIAGVFLLYGLSVLYGLAYSYPYASHIYSRSFTRVLGDPWDQRLVIIVGTITIFYLLVTLFLRGHALAVAREWLLGLRQFLPLVFLAFLLLGAYKAYQLGFTDAFLEHSWYGKSWKAAGTGVKAFLYWSPFVLFEYLSPFIGMLFCYVLVTTRKKLTAERSLLLLFLLFFFAYICVMQWFIPYQYYYARYLLSEVLPYMLLYTVTGVAGLPKLRKTAYAMLACAAIYMLAITATQFRGEDMGGFKESLDELAQYVTPEDILIVDQRWMYSAMWSEIKTPLIFQYDLNVVSSDINTVNSFIDHFCFEEQQSVYYLSSGRQPGLGQPHKIWRVSVEAFEKMPYIPTKIAKGSITHYLYWVSCSRWLRSQL